MTIFKTFYNCTCTLIVFLKNFFVKGNFEKSQQTTTKARKIAKQYYAVRLDIFFLFFQEYVQPYFDKYSHCCLWRPNAFNIIVDLT